MIVLRYTEIFDQKLLKNDEKKCESLENPTTLFRHEIAPLALARRASSFLYYSDYYSDLYGKYFG